MPASDMPIEVGDPTGLYSPGNVLTVHPGHALLGELGAEGVPALPGDKSLSHRAALFAALAEGESQVRNFLVSGVTEAMLEALTALGVRWRLERTTLTVQGVGMELTADLPSVSLNCGNSATTLRLLTGALAAWGRAAVLDGSPGLRKRPMGRIIAPLRMMGVDLQAENDCAPLVIKASSASLSSIGYRLPVASAQVKSCLLLAALRADGTTTLMEPGPSRDHSERMLRAMDVRVTSQASAKDGQWLTRLEPPRPLRLKALEVTLPGDMSAAAFLIIAALVTPGSSVRLHGVGLNPTRTGLLDTLLEMGAEIETSNLREQGGEPTGDLSVSYSPLHGVQIGGERVVRMIDEFPAFTIAAACAQGASRVTEAQELRHKESDRISALGGELRRLGVDFQETADGFLIQGGSPLQGGKVEAHGDHRLAMALALAGLVAQSQVEVSGAEIIAESFPGFEQVLRALGAEINYKGNHRKIR